MRILIIEADTLLRDGLCALLRLDNDFDVIGTLDSVKVIASVALGKTPDIVVVDTASPGCGGIDAIEKIHHRWPHARVLVLTSRQEDRVMAEAFSAGADAYLLKSDSRQDLTNALHGVAQGLRYVSQAMNRQARDRSISGQHQSDGLTDRERDVMRGIAQGRRTREIALALSLSQKTIEKYRSSLMRKLGLKTATAVAAYAIVNGYLANK
jgi:two-component system secretion response regulator SsrB